MISHFKGNSRNILQHSTVFPYLLLPQYHRVAKRKQQTPLCWLHAVFAICCNNETLCKKCVYSSKEWILNCFEARRITQWQTRTGRGERGKSKSRGEWFTSNNRDVHYLFVLLRPDLICHWEIQFQYCLYASDYCGLSSSDEVLFWGLCDRFNSHLLPFHSSSCTFFQPLQHNRSRPAVDRTFKHNATTTFFSYLYSIQNINNVRRRP